MANCGFELRFGLDKLIQTNIQKYVLRTLKSYTRVKLSRLAELTGIDLDVVRELLIKLIIDGELNYVVDGASQTLVRVETPVAESEQLLRQACEVVEVLETWV